MIGEKNLALQPERERRRVQEMKQMVRDRNKGPDPQRGRSQGSGRSSVRGRSPGRGVKQE